MHLPRVQDAIGLPDILGRAVEGTALALAHSLVAASVQPGCLHLVAAAGTMVWAKERESDVYTHYSSKLNTIPVAVMLVEVAIEVVCMYFAEDKNVQFQAKNHGL